MRSSRWKSFKRPSKALRVATWWAAWPAFSQQDEPPQSFPRPPPSPLVSANHSPEILKPTTLVSMSAWHLLLLVRKSFSVDALLCPLRGHLMWFHGFSKKASYLPRVFLCWEFSGNMLRTKTPLKPFPALSVDIFFMAISLNKLDLVLHVLQGFSHSEMALWGQFCLSWSFSSGHISEMFHIDFGSISRLFDSGVFTLEWLGVNWRVKFPNWIHCRIIVSVKETN